MIVCPAQVERVAVKMRFWRVEGCTPRYICTGSRQATRTPTKTTAGE